MLSRADVNLLPDSPGVYFFKSKSSEILYIGKAKSLRERVGSYTYPSYKHSRRTRQLVRRTKKVDHIVCGSELEALLLESRLIKEHLPEYNVMQRRLRNYPFIKITMKEDFPRVFVAWEIELDGAKYLGPFPRWYDAQEAVNLIHKVFPVRKCGRDFYNVKPGVPCLNYHIKRCMGPCAGKVTRSDYRKNIGSVIKLLSGHWEKLIHDTEREMKEAAAILRFEKAANLRDQISDIRDIVSRHQFHVKSVEDNNLIAIYPSGSIGSVEMFFIRKGVLEEQKKISISAQEDDSLLTTAMIDIERVFFNNSEDKNKHTGQLEIDAMNIISRWLYRHRNDQSLVYIKGKRNKNETIIHAAAEIKRVVQLLVPV